MKTTYKPAFAALRRSRQNLLAAALLGALERVFDGTRERNNVDQVK
jgi:hypothetical protein